MFHRKSVSTVLHNDHNVDERWPGKQWFWSSLVASLGGILRCRCRYVMPSGFDVRQIWHDRCQLSMWCREKTHVFAALVCSRLVSSSVVRNSSLLALSFTCARLWLHRDQLPPGRIFLRGGKGNIPAPQAALIEQNQHGQQANLSVSSMPKGAKVEKLKSFVCTLHLERTIQFVWYLPLDVA